MVSESHKNLLAMNGKVVLVTGASSGLGAHFARVLAAAGASVAVGARRADRLDALVQELKATGATAMAVPLDVTSTQSVSSALELIEEAFGIVTVLINNAGVADSRYCLNVDEDSWDFVMDTNLKGAWCVAKEVAKGCIGSKCEGSIVNVASILGLRQSFGESTYATAKAGLVQLTKAMALELGSKGVRVNAICPGYFSTELNADYLASEAGQAMLDKSPFRRAGQLEELDGPLLLLASEAGRFMTGTAIPVDGGHLVSAL
ncbi:MAG: SDR family oxidoreductase [Halioglobus sp.]